MKKRNVFFYSALALGMVGTLASCSSDDDIVAGGVVDGGNVASSGQVIEIAVENAGSGLETRAGRPLNSSEANQTITNLKVIVVDKNGSVVADRLYTDWQNVSEAYNDASGHGRKVRFTLEGSNKLDKGGEYTVYAFGYDNESKYTVTNTDATVSADNETLISYLAALGNGYNDDLTASDEKEVNASEKYTKFQENLILQNSANNVAEEIFAGSAEVEMDENGKFSQGVTLHRQVAGVFSYMYEIPYMVTIENGKVTDWADHLQLVAVKKNNDLVLGSFYSKTLGNNGGHDNSNNPINVLENVINGTTESDTEYVVYDINLRDWFKELVDEDNDGVLDRYGFYVDADGKLQENKTKYTKVEATAENAKHENDDEWVDVKEGDYKALNWQKPLAGEKERFENTTFVKGSVFGGEFIIPFLKSDDYTFKLRLVSLNGQSVKTSYREWTVSLPTYDVLGNDKTITQWDTNAWKKANANGESTSAYSVLRNHLYGVGAKASNDPTDGGEDPDDPTPDEEDPEDLNTKQDLMLQVCDNWELIHKMVIE